MLLRPPVGISTSASPPATTCRTAGSCWPRKPEKPNTRRSTWAGSIVVGSASIPRGYLQALPTSRIAVATGDSIGRAAPISPRSRDPVGVCGPPGRPYSAWMLPSHVEIEAADTRAREWQWPIPGALRIGSDSHRDAACRMFRDTFTPYKPSVIDWPKLDPDALHRLTSLPIWDIAVSTEN